VAKRLVAIFEESGRLVVAIDFLLVWDSIIEIKNRQDI